MFRVCKKKQEIHFYSSYRWIIWNNGIVNSPSCKVHYKSSKSLSKSI